MASLFKTIILALVSAALAIILEQSLALTVSIFEQKELVLEFYSHLTWFLVFGAIIEEILKFWALSYVMRKKFGLRGKGFVFLSAFLGLVWGIFESALVLVSSSSTFSQFKTGNSEIIFSLAVVILLHILTAFLMGALISSGAFSGRTRYAKIIFFAVFIHLLFNFLVIQKGDYTNWLIGFAFGTVFILNLLIFTFNYRRLD